MLVELAFTVAYKAKFFTCGWMVAISKKKFCLKYFCNTSTEQSLFQS